MYILSTPFSASRSDGVDTKEYSSADAFDAIFDFAFKPTRQGRPLTEKQRFVQKYYVETMMRGGMFKTPQSSQQRLAVAEPVEDHSHHMHTCGLCSGDDPCSAGEFRYDPVSGFEWIPRYTMAVGDITQAVMYGQLMKAYEAMNAAKASANATDRAHYELLMGTIAYSLK